MKLHVLIKDINIKTLVSGDKSARIVLETLSEDDVNKLSKLVGEREAFVIFDTLDKKK